MTRMIDADKLEAHEQLIPFGNGMYETTFIVYKDDIDEQPTVDAVPVVRCRDCTYHKEKRCTVWRERAVIVECYTDDDGYCYKGVRKEE